MRTLPDYLRRGMRLVIVGCNPGERSARLGHYYAGRGNLFWPLLYDSKILPEPVEYNDDRCIIEFGIGLTHPLNPPTPGIQDITAQENPQAPHHRTQNPRELLQHIATAPGSPL